MNMGEAFRAIEERGQSIGDPEAVVGKEEELHFLLVGTDVDIDEAREMMAASETVFLTSLTATEGDVRLVLGSMMLHAFLAGHLMASSNA